MDYGSFVPWGLWVAFDLFFLGLTAGAFIITIMIYGFRIKLFASLGSAVRLMRCWSRCCARVLSSAWTWAIPSRVYRFLITPNFGSMLFWLVVFIVGMWVIYLPWLYFLLREQLIAWSQDEHRQGIRSIAFWSGVRPLIASRIASRIIAGAPPVLSSVCPWACYSLGPMALFSPFC